jgi:cytochrome oxidase Cu insertion factor (SCO1/SenC/PrrC family)
MRKHIAGLLTAMILVFGSSAPPAQEKTPPPEPSVGVGDEAPDFTLKDQNLEEVTLSDFRGKKKVILAFYVFAFTGG